LLQLLGRLPGANPFTVRSRKRLLIPEVFLFFCTAVLVHGSLVPLSFHCNSRCFDEAASAISEGWTAALAWLHLFSPSPWKIASPLYGNLAEFVQVGLPAFFSNFSPRLGHSHGLGVFFLVFFLKRCLFPPLTSPARIRFLHYASSPGLPNSKTVFYSGQSIFVLFNGTPDRFFIHLHSVFLLTVFRFPSLTFLGRPSGQIISSVSFSPSLNLDAIPRLIEVGFPRLQLPFSLWHP